MRGAGQINIEIIKNATLRLLDEAAISIMRSGYSTLIKEVKDLSVSLHDLMGSCWPSR